MTTRCLTLAILILAARTASAHTPIAPPSHKSGKPLALPLNESAYAALQRLWSERSDSPFGFAHAEGANAGQAIHDLKKGFATAVENAGIEDF